VKRNQTQRGGTGIMFTGDLDTGITDPEDMVNSPTHYNQGGLECIDAIRHALGEDGFIAYCRGNALKYNWRAGHKSNSQEDLQKAAWYSRMASGDDPRKDAEYPVVQATVINPKLHPVNKTPEFEGYVPPECDDRIGGTPTPRDIQLEQERKERWGRDG